MSNSLTSFIANPVGTATDKAIAYGTKWINHKVDFGLAYGEGLLRQYDLLGILPEAWTILDVNGQKAWDFDSFNKSSTKIESRVTQYPVEGGGFVSYNAVTTPLELRCVLIKQGYPFELQYYVEALNDYCNSTNLLNVVTPEHEYPNMKLAKVTFDRSAEDGTDRIIAECSFIEIRQVEMEYTNVKIPAPQDNGLTQAKNTSWLRIFGVNLGSGSSNNMQGSNNGGSTPSIPIPQTWGNMNKGTNPLKV